MSQDTLKQLFDAASRPRPLSSIYKAPLGLMTDLYQISMAAGYFEQGMHNHEAVFNLHFRKNPFKGGFSVAAGMAHTIDYLQNFVCYSDDDVGFLSTLVGNDGRPLFKDKFLRYLRDMRFTGDVDMVDEGEFVNPMEAFVRVKAPIIQGQIVETPLLCLNNFGTLIATKTSRVGLACAGDPFLDFGLRRAQGFDGALLAAWASYLAGATGTSNVLAGRLFGIPVKGTFAHSWVMSFLKEIDSFFSYARAMGNNCTFLVDTYNTIQGIKNAIKVGLWLKEHGFNMGGIRLDSGNLAELSRIARQMLDDAGLTSWAIVASNDLDERKITRIKIEGGRVGVWGVGTMMITAYDQPALGGVYKLAAIRAPGEDWRYAVKLSEDDIKVSIPGIQRIHRYSRGGEFIGDVIYDELRSTHSSVVDFKTRKAFTMRHFAGADCEEILHAAIREGQVVRDSRYLPDIRAFRAERMEHVPAAVKKLVRPSRYPIYLEGELDATRNQMIAEAKAEALRQAA